MKLNEYQNGALSTDELWTPGQVGDMTAQELRLAMGVADEGGEVLGKYKKGLRGSDESINHDEVADELGDVLWYVALLSHEIGMDLEDVARANLAKLGDRKQRGVLAGSGDNR